MDQNLSSYRIFYVVAKEGNISKASKELFISQPAISKSISKLEASLDVILFHRNSRGVVLTDEGQILYEACASAFDTLNLANKRIDKIKNLGIGHIRIGVSSTLCKYILLPYLKKFLEKYPHIKITIECHSTFETIKALEENKIDIGLIGHPNEFKDMDFYPIQEIHDCFVTTKSYLENLEIRQEKVDEDTIFNTANLMLLNEKNITRIYIEKYFEENNITTNQVLEVSSMDLLIDFAKIGLGIACVIGEFVEEELINGTLIEIPLKNAIQKRQVGFAYSTKFPVSDAMNKFIQFYEEQ
ncbi:MAG: LysR family transcriptional regulator [bacterium]|nr:LysR family transcriptional regulator [bacterium]